MTAPANEKEVRVHGARAFCICEVNLLAMRQVPLTGERVALVMVDFCIEIHVTQDQMPAVLKSFYEEARAHPGKLFNKDAVIAALNVAA